MNKPSIHVALAAAVATVGLAGVAKAAVVTSSLDYAIQTNGTNDAPNSVDGRLLVKQSDSDPTTNRVGFVQFDLASLTDPFGDATLQLSYTRSATGSPDNRFAAGAVLQLFGIPEADDGLAEGDGTNFLNAANDDGTTNSVLDSQLVLLDEFTVASADDNTVTFGGGLADFLLADVDNTGSFIVTSRTLNPNAQTPFFFTSDVGESPTNTAAFVPTITTAVPEPASLSLLGLSGLGLIRRRRQA